VWREGGAEGGWGPTGALAIADWTDVVVIDIVFDKGHVCDLYGMGISRGKRENLVFLISWND
jgi:hypothetical protein